MSACITYLTIHECLQSRPHPIIFPEHQQTLGLCFLSHGNHKINGCCDESNKLDCMNSVLVFYYHLNRFSTVNHFKQQLDIQSTSIYWMGQKSSLNLGFSS